MTGFTTGCPTGNPEESLLGFSPVYEASNATRGIIPIRPAPGCGNMYYCYGADGKSNGVVWAAEGSEQFRTVFLDPTKESHDIFCEPLGSWSEIGEINVIQLTLEVTALLGNMISAQFNASAEFIHSYGDSAQLTSWSLTGLERYSNSRPGNLRRTQAVCDVTLTNSGSIRTVKVMLNGKILCQGSRSGNGSITLSEVDSSGVSGSVTVTYTADVLSGATITKRYAAQYTISAGSKSTTIDDDGISNVLYGKIGPFAAGTYTVTITPISDTGISGTPATGSATVYEFPQRGGVISLDSGTNVNNTEIAFDPSETVDVVQYNIYDVKELDEATYVEEVSVVADNVGSPIIVALKALGFVATGGTITSVGGYTYHTFTATAFDTFNVLSNPNGKTAQVFVLGGGGGGCAGGGGAGGAVIASSYLMELGAHTVFVGDGGLGKSNNVAPGDNGIDSTFQTPSLNVWRGKGGGGGGTQTGPSPAPDGIAGGCGGGGSYVGGVSNGGASNQGPSTGAIDYGFAGGGGYFGPNFPAGGGGGCGSVGVTAVGAVGGGNGGSGVAFYDPTTGLSKNYGGGGGGACFTNSTGGTGSDGGGNGGDSSNPGTNGTASTGGGGGGSRNGFTGGSGGSGIIIIRYAN